MVRIVSVAVLAALFSLPTAQSYEWRVTDWSNCSNIGHQESLDWWSSAGNLKLSRWEKVLDYYPLGCSWKCFVGYIDFLESSEGWIYASTDLAGVFRTSDGGHSWSRSSDLADSVGAGQMVEDPEGAIYVAGEVDPFFRGRVFKSTDRGWTWESVGGVLGTYAYRLLGAFVDDIFTLFAPIYLEVSPDYGFIYKSTNGGLDWESTGFRFPAGIHLMIQSSDGAIYFCSEDGIHKTEDGFESWSKVYPDPPYTVTTCLLENEDGHIYAGFHDGTVIRTGDGGITWDTLSQIPAGNLYSMDEDSDGNLYTHSGYEPICIYKSTDEGLSWFMIGDFQKSWFNEGHELTAFMVDSSNNIYVGGYPELPEYGGHQVIAKRGKDYALEGYCIPYSYDTELANGAAWGKIDWDATLNGGQARVRISTKPLPVGDWEYATKGQDISDLNSVEDGDRYVTYQVEFYRSRQDTTPVLHEIWIEYEEYVGVEEEQEPEEKLMTRLFPIQPSLVQEAVSIEYQVGRRCRVVLSVYDVAGRFQKELIDGEKEAGRYTVMWDGTDDSGKRLASGIYMVRLHSGGYTETQKLLVVR